MVGGPATLLLALALKCQRESLQSPLFALAQQLEMPRMATAHLPAPLRDDGNEQTVTTCNVSRMTDTSAASAPLDLGTLVTEADCVLSV